jgi:hypothetical protein
VRSDGAERHYVVAGVVSAERERTLYRVDYNLDGIGPAVYIDAAELMAVSLLLEEV